MTPIKKLIVIKIKVIETRRIDTNTEVIFKSTSKRRMANRNIATLKKRNMLFYSDRLLYWFLSLLKLLFLLLLFWQLLRFECYQLCQFVLLLLSLLRWAKLSKKNSIKNYIIVVFNFKMYLLSIASMYQKQKLYYGFKNLLCKLAQCNVCAVM